MKSRLSLILFLSILLSVGSTGFAQKKNPRLQSGQNLRNTILDMLRSAKETKVGASTCDPSKLLKSLPKKKLVPSKEDLKKEIDRMMDSLTYPKSVLVSTSHFDAMEYFNQVTKMTDFVFKVQKKDYGQVPPSRRKVVQDYYFQLKRAKKEGFNLKKISFTHKKCKVTVLTNLKPVKWVRGYKKNAFVMGMDWKITTDITFECPCVNNSDKDVKKATYSYTADTKGPMRFNDLGLNLKPITRYGLRFEKVTTPKYVLAELRCCLVSSNPPQDGSFVSPDEDINDETQYIDTSVGISFGSEEETEAIAFAGWFFQVANIGENPLYVGPKLTVNTTALNGNDFKATRFVVGPSAEYKIPVGSGSTQIITGVNAGYSFGNIDSFGFEQTTSGFNVGAYTGVEIGIGPNLGLGILLNFFEYNNTTFKAKEDDFKTTVSNSTFLTDRAGITVGVRLGLD
ncbi:MAG: hypothetical protein AAF466_00670 [Bacteroidota bacterium]